MMPLSPALFLAAASALVASDLRLPRRSKPERGALDPDARDTHAPEDGVATAALIAHVGYWSHRRAVGRSSWPLPLGADCDELARIGSARGVLISGTPDPGAIYLRWSDRDQRFVRAAIVLSAMDVPPQAQGGWTYDCHVLEGRAALTCPETGEPRIETTLHWARQGRVTCCPGLGDCFLSWVDLDRRHEIGRPSWRQAA
jgi:hypothetical protein